MYFYFLYSFIAVELCLGSLNDLVNGKMSCFDKNPRAILNQISLGLEHLHTLKIIHGNLHPSNVLVSRASGTARPSIKLAEFGLRYRKPSSGSDCLTLEEEHQQQLLALRSSWLSPDRKLTAASDIFILGLLFCFVLKPGCHPFGDQDMERFSRIVKKEPMTFTAEDLKNIENSVQVIILIQSMLSYDAEGRPTAEEVLKSSFFVGESQRKNISRPQAHVTLDDQGIFPVVMFFSGLK